MNVLIAPLGESPAVVTAMAQALRDHPDGPGVEIETVVVLYPQGDYVKLGLTLIEGVLSGLGCTLVQWPLGEKDVDSYEANVAFLQTLDRALEQHRDGAVYVSCAGGRKSMSALAAVITQFYPHVQGLYHILDRFENQPQRRNFYTIEGLYDLPEQQLTASMLPSMDSVHLINVPFQALSAPEHLRRYYTAPIHDDEAEDTTIDTGGAAEMFFRQALGNAPISRLLELRFSERAREQFLELYRTDRPRAEHFLKCFGQMRDPDVLRERLKFAFSARGHSYHYYKLRRTVERPLYRTEPYPIESGKPVQRVVIVGLSIEQGNGTYEPSDKDWKAVVAQHEVLGRYTLHDLIQRPGVLVMPVGTSPMIVSQTVMLLRSLEAIAIAAIGLVYPERNNAIGEGVEILRDLFKRAGADPGSGRAVDPIDVVLFPIARVADIDSTEACEACGRTVSEAVAIMRERYHEHNLHVSISGGRKTMVAMTYYGAQRAGLRQVWHTLIADRTLADRVQRETTLEELKRVDRQTRAARLSLVSYSADLDHFSLFPIPVIPVQ